MIENLLSEVKREKFKLYSQIIDNLEDLKLDKEQTSNILEIFDKIFIKFIEKSLILKRTNNFEDPIQISITKSNLSNNIEGIKNRLSKGINKSKIDKNLKKSFGKNLSININNPETYKSLYKHIKYFSILNPVFNNYLEMNYFEALQEIYLVYNDNSQIIDTLIKSNSLIIGIYEDNFIRSLSWKKYNYEYLNEEIEKFESYLKEQFAEHFNLQETINEFIDELTIHKERHRRYRINMIEKYKKENENWIEGNYHLVLDMYREIRGKIKQGIVEEGKTVMEILDYLNRKFHELRDTTYKARLLYAEKILDIIDECEDIYPAVSRHKDWAQKEYKAALEILKR